MKDLFFHPLPQLDIGLLNYFSILGRALFTAQHFETNCRALAGFLLIKEDQAKNGSNLLEAPEFHSKMNKLWGQSLGSIILRIPLGISRPNDISQALDEARDARNQIAHWATVGVDIKNETELSTRINEISILVQKVARADKYIATLLHVINKDSIPADAFFRQYEKTVADWVCEPAFGESK